MPVITRSQSKQIAASEVQPVITRNLNKDADYIEMEHSFVSTVNRLLLLCSSAEGKENKMRVVLEVFQIVNRCLPKLVEYKKRDVFLRFAATVFNKTTEMLEDEERGGWAWVDKALAKKFKTELLKSREFTGSYVKANSLLSPNQHTCVFRAEEDIQKMKKSRHWRAIMRVEYRDMDMIVKALEEIQKMEKSRPRRSVTRVDYRDMEPEF